MCLNDNVQWKWLTLLQLKLNQAAQKIVSHLCLYNLLCNWWLEVIKYKWGLDKINTVGKDVIAEPIHDIVFVEYVILQH